MTRSKVGVWASRSEVRNVKAMRIRVVVGGVSLMLVFIVRTLRG
jgi:hypothetical protein